jgi:hypothetical protein
MSSESMTSDPETVVQRQFDAYNAKDMEAFLATYAPAVEMRDLPSNDLLRSGHDELRAFYETRFSNANLRAELVARSVLGNMVVDTERLTGFDDGRVLEIVAINEVRDGLIQRCWFVHA